MPVPADRIPDDVVADALRAALNIDAAAPLSDARAAVEAMSGAEAIAALRAVLELCEVDVGGAS